MFIYFFLLAAAVATSELPITNIEDSSFVNASTDIMTDEQEIQELIALFAQEMQIDANLTAQPAKEQTVAAQIVSSAITITNAIQPTMLEYKHWTGRYSPEQFAISINGTEIETGKTHEIPANTTTVEIGYTYSFMNGMRTGGKTISYQLNENVTQLNITFDWKNDWRVIVDNGKAIKEITS